MRKSYVIEVLFMLVLFTIFVLGSFIILIFGADSYNSLVQSHNGIEELRLTQAFIGNKLAQTSVNEDVSIEYIDGGDVLVIKEYIGDNEYATYIYYEEGKLYEVYVKVGAFDKKYANEITEISSFEMEDKNGVLQFSIANSDDKEHTFIFNLR